MSTLLQECLDMNKENENWEIKNKLMVFEGVLRTI